MKKITIFSLLLLTACSVQKSAIEQPDNKLALSNHTAPIKIFGIGRYATNSMILTLVDAENHYFTIEAPADTALKIGAVYNQKF